MTEGIGTAIIGVGGTLIGTLLGWLLGKINVGKLRIKVDFVRRDPYYLNSEGKKKFNYYDFQMIIRLFNNSSKNIGETIKLNISNTAPFLKKIIFIFII